MNYRIDYAYEKIYVEENGTYHWLCSFAQIRARKSDSEKQILRKLEKSKHSQSPFENDWEATMYGVDPSRYQY